MSREISTLSSAPHRQSHPHFSPTPLESALTKNRLVTPLQSALTIPRDLKSFRIRTYKNTQGRGPTVNHARPSAILSPVDQQPHKSGAAEDAVIKPESRCALRKVLLAIPLSASLVAFAQPYLPQALAQSGSATPVHCHSLGTQDEIPPDKLPAP